MCQQCFRGESSAPEPAHSSDSSDESVEIFAIPPGTITIRSQPPTPISHLGVTIRWSQIIEGTENFSNINFLGQGNFGEVFRCNLPTMPEVGAVKIQRLPDINDHPEYVAELTALHESDHPNMIKLLGKCYQRNHRAIVYQFMPNGSLDHHLYGNMMTHPYLNWEKRVSIALGVAEALAYLHNFLKTIHRDVKVSNILLDENYVPKLSDFGFATRVIEDENGEEIPIQMFPIKGSMGYIAPETERYGFVSTKSDVYSYGVFLITLFTGQKVYDLERPFIRRKISDWFNPIVDGHVRYLSLVSDVALGNRFSRHGLDRIIEIARICTMEEADFRPSMASVESSVRSVSYYEVLNWSQDLERSSM